ncbi:hypothetical protein DICVIV_04738 [Dictyocaulus viviparus]|uniref:Uncharacterized protein n=1 Tax=Dictyocaulus viviparus TaxID=29172 RepID=A0A0D8XWR7_DICVI|nr:hypothetical protein DICVIV_04738 [Dictyocaulus viviparus]
MILLLIFLTITAYCNVLPRTDKLSNINDNPLNGERMDLGDVFNTMLLKKKEKSPLQKTTADDEKSIPNTMSEDYRMFESQPGIAPKMTGSAVNWSSPGNFEYFDFGENSDAIVNPAATYLEGGDFEKICSDYNIYIPKAVHENSKIDVAVMLAELKINHNRHLQGNRWGRSDANQIVSSKCILLGCNGPVVNDGTLFVKPIEQENKACHQAFIPINSCTNNKGYPMGMLCSICCECSIDFITEMKKTKGYKIGYDANA